MAHVARAANFQWPGDPCDDDLVFPVQGVAIAVAQLHPATSLEEYPGSYCAMGETFRAG